MANHNPNSYTRAFMEQMKVDSASDRSDDTQIVEYLRQIAESVANIQTKQNQGPTPGGPTGSQSAARDAADATRARRDPFGQHHANNSFGGRNAGSSRTFLDGFEKSLLEAYKKSDFFKKMQSSLNKFAEAMGSDIENLQEDMGEAFGSMIARDFQKSKLGTKMSSILEKYTGSLFQEGADNGMSQLGELFNQMKNDQNFTMENFTEGLQGIDMGTFGNLFKNGLGSATKFFSKFEALGGSAFGAAMAMKMLQTASEGVTDVLGGLSKMLDVLKAAGNRYSESRKKDLEAANKRLQEDVNTLIEQPFELLKKAAEEVYSAWNANIRLITGTQGYNKADLQDLMAAYAQRLQDEGLSNVIAATDVYNNLAKVIQSGLTGTGAVEFAYQATKYGAAIPNQDFFSYVDTYSSIVANAIASGKSETEALDLATASLRDFADSLLYADRSLTGGYSTALKAADSLYSSATKIAQAAKSENISGISNALLAIQGYVGAIAPDLASTLSDKIYQLAVGGNASDIVALRSLAGINASNTEFLRALSNNPQQVLAAMFSNLGNMYTQSPDAFMEKAEGYASLFGLSAEAFQRIDFNSLAAAILNISSGVEYNQDLLDENFKLLKDGQTTTTTDQLKIAQINKYMVEEGLAYVIDNEAAQLIQQHMWQEQQTRELTEAEYGVNLVGGSAEALQKILSGIDKVLTIINPVAWIVKGVSKLVSIGETAADAAAQQKDIQKVLELSKVGTGNRSDLYKLISRNENLQLTESLVDLLGGTASYKSYNDSTVMKVIQGLTHPLEGLSDLIRTSLHEQRAGIYFADKIGSSSSSSSSWSSLLPSSQYDWGSISKNNAAVASALLRSSNATAEVTHKTVSQLTGAVSASVAAMQGKVEQMLSDEYLYEQFVKKGRSYQDWLASAVDMGIVDMETAMKEAGYESSDVEEYFSAKQAEAGGAEKAKQYADEQAFRDAGTQFWTSTFWSNYDEPLTSLLTNGMTSISNSIDSIRLLQQGWQDNQLSVLKDLVTGQINWKEYFDTTWVATVWKTDFVGESGLLQKFFDQLIGKMVEDTYYTEGKTYTDVASIQRQEKENKDNAIYSLADALTGGLVNLQDPQAQTNALLAQILIVATAIMNQNNNVAGTTSLSDALTSLALGLTQTTPINETPT